MQKRRVELVLYRIGALASAMCASSVSMMIATLYTMNILTIAVVGIVAAIATFVMMYFVLSRIVNNSL